MAPPDRKGGSGLSLRTLTIASAASLTAAMVSSRLFPPGTIYASAVTPVIVAAVSEMLHKPVDRVTELARQRRTMVMEAQMAPDAAIASAPLEERDLPQRPLRRRILHPKVWLVTGLCAFALAAALLTLPELVFGGAVATKHRTTFFGGGSSSPAQSTQNTTTTTKTVTQTVPAQSPATTETQTGTQTTTTDTGTGTTTTPSGGTAPPADSGSSTSPSPAPTGTTP